MVDRYGTSAGFTAYHTARGTDVTDYDDAEIQPKLLVASEWVDGKWRSLFPGLKNGHRAQVREWPRYGGFDVYADPIASDSIPDEVTFATYEAALRELAVPGALNVDWTPPKYRRASIDGAVSVEYATFNSASDVQTQFAVIDQILSPILTGGLMPNVSSLSGSSIHV